MVFETKQDGIEEYDYIRSYEVAHREIAKEMEGKKESKAERCMKKHHQMRREKVCEEFRKSMRQNENMKATVRKVDEKEALDTLCAHCRLCREELHFIPGQGYIQCVIKVWEEGNHRSYRPLQVM